MKETRELAFKCPVDGRVALLAETPDTVFSQEKVGCGVVIFPTNDTILAPTDGKVMMIFPTKHAIAIECANGIEYLIHVGINTIAMAGEGFSCCVQEKQDIRQGDRLLRFDSEKIRSSGCSDAIPVVFTNISKESLHVIKGGTAKAGEIILKVTGKPKY